MLQARGIGLRAVVMSVGDECDIEHIQWDLDFNLVDEYKLVRSLIDDGVLPTNKGLCG